LTKLVVQGLLGKLDLSHQHRLDPVATFHDCRGDALTPICPVSSQAGSQKGTSSCRSSGGCCKGSPKAFRRSRCRLRRLEQFPGIGAKRIAGIRDTLAQRLGRIRQGLTAPVQRNDATVAELLDVDRQYREEAARGTLQKIAPRRFNPSGEAWLPILHTTRGPRHYTALFCPGA
jgi:hypothetical protein